jgi:hypothetical protein
LGEFGEVLKFESAKVLKLGEFGEVLKFESAKVLKWRIET